MGVMRQSKDPINLGCIVKTAYESGFLVARDQLLSYRTTNKLGTKSDKLVDESSICESIQRGPSEFACP